MSGVTRMRVEANGRTETEVKDHLAEEVRSFCRRHVSRAHWKIEEQIQTTRDGFWGFAVLTPVRTEDQ